MGLSMMIGRFVEACKRRILKLYAKMRKGMVLEREEGLIYEVNSNERKLEYILKLKYLVRVERNLVKKVVSGKILD